MAVGGKKSLWLSHQSQKEKRAQRERAIKWQEEPRCGYPGLEEVRRTCLSNLLLSSYNVQSFPKKWL